MARARAVETRLERQLPAVDEFFISGFLNKEEVLELTRMRTHWEYRLVAKPLLLLDVQNAVKAELALEERLRQYCQRTRVNLKHRWSVLERIEYIYDVGVKHLKSKSDRELIRREYVLFLKSFNRTGTLSKFYGRLMIMYPTRSDLWVEAALWEGIDRRNVDHGRAIVQQALVTMGSEPTVWATALRLELEFARRLLDGVLEEHGAMMQKKRRAAREVSLVAAGNDAEAKADNEEEDQEPALSETLRRENAAMAELMLDLALPNAVVEEAFESAASGPELLRQLLALCAEYGFAKDVMVKAVDIAVRKAYDVLVRGISASTSNASTVKDSRKRPGAGAGAAASLPATQLERTRWAGAGLASILRAHLLFEDKCCAGGLTGEPLVDATTFLDSEAAQEHGKGGSRPRGADRLITTPWQRRVAATASLAALLSFAALPRTIRSVLSGGKALVIWQEVVLAGALQLLATLAATATPESVSRVCLLLMTRHATQTGGGHSSQPLDEKDVQAALEAIVYNLTSVNDAKCKATKAEMNALKREYLAPAQARVQALVALAGAEEKGPITVQKRRNLASADSRTDGDGKDDDDDVERWPSSLLGRFLTTGDRLALTKSFTAAAAAASGEAKKKKGTLLSDAEQSVRERLTSDDVDQLLLWCRAEEKAATAGENAERAAVAAAAAAARSRIRAAVWAFFRRFGLLPASATGGEANASERREATAAHRKKGKGSKADASTTAVRESNSDESSAHPLLRAANAITYLDPVTTPLCIWRVFNALEVTEGAALFAAEPSQALTQASSPHRKFDTGSCSSPSSSSDCDDYDGGTDNARLLNGSGKRDLCFGSYAAAGAHFLATAPHGALDRQGQLDRAVGLSSLARSRLFSLTGLRVSGPAAREDVLKWLMAAQTARRPSPAHAAATAMPLTGNEAVDATDVGARVKAMEAFIKELEIRCQPLPRQCQVSTVIPFLEAVAMAAPSGPASVEAVRQAREAHERLLSLYSLTERLSDFIPVLYRMQRDGVGAEGAVAAGVAISTTATSASLASLQPKHTELKASQQLVSESNAEDWIAYVVFERWVAKDLARARTIAERARRFCLAPQRLLVLLNSASSIS